MRTRALRPGLGREIGRDLAQIALGQVLGDGRHDRAVALAVPEVAQLLHEVALLLAPDDRNGLGVGRNAFVAVACRTELRLRLDLIRGMRRRDGGRKADPHSENRRKTRVNMTIFLRSHDPESIASPGPEAKAWQDTA